MKKEETYDIIMMIKYKVKLKCIYEKLFKIKNMSQP